MLPPRAMHRRVGQHFRRSASVERMLRVVDPRSDQDFLEIGAGSGALTLPLAARARRVAAVEIDPVVAKRLEDRAPAYATLAAFNVVFISLIGASTLMLSLGVLAPMMMASALLKLCATPAASVPIASIL